MLPPHSHQQLLDSQEYIETKKKLMHLIQTRSQSLHQIRPPLSPEVHQNYLDLLQSFTQQRGRDLFYHYLSSGIGNGPYVELLDGSVKMDLITGIGINFFGHSYPPFMEEMIHGLSSDVMQGNLQPGVEAQEVLDLILKNVGSSSRIKHGWLFGSGTMSNETALKIIRQKKAPATRVFAFSDCFAGRSTAMQEITDNPAYRQGQPTYGEVFHLPFYNDQLSLEKNIFAVIQKMDEEIKKSPNAFAGLMIELIQGEGGIRFAPRDFYVSIFEHAKKHDIAIWIDEVQTFGRTTELFAYQMLNLESYVDVVTVGKLLHVCMTLYTEEFNPKPGLVAGTFTGSVSSLRCAKRALEILTKEGFYGPQGKIAKLSSFFVKQLTTLQESSCAGKINQIRAQGGMIGFSIFHSTLKDTKAFLQALFNNGVIGFYAGHDPYIVRLLPPFGVMTEEQITEACQIIEKTLRSFSHA